MTIATIDQCRSRESRGNRAGGADVSVLIEHLRDVDCAGLLGFSSSSGKGPCVNRGPRGQQWVI